MYHGNKTVSIRFSNQDAALLREIAEHRGQNVSDLVRFSVKRELARLDLLTEEEMNCLGLKK